MASLVFPRGLPDDGKLEYLYKRARVEDRGYDTPCMIDTCVSRTTKGYPHIWGSLGMKTVASYILATRLGYVEEAGHLCHHTDCINPAHIEETSRWLNALDRTLHRAQNGEYTTVYPGVYMDKTSSGIYYRVIIGRHVNNSNGREYIGYYNDIQDAASIALTLYLEELEQEPEWIQETKIFQRCKGRLLELLVELYQGATA